MKNNTALFFIKLLISIVITLIILILIKSSSSFKTFFYKEIYNTHLSFAPLSNIYNTYIGKLDIFSDMLTEPVFNEELLYLTKEQYKDGVKLELQNNLVPINESGIVIYIGEKEDYGNTIIIQRIDGVDEWYGGINNANVNLYDYVNKGDILGEVDKYLFLIYKKDGNVLNYEEYLK